MACFDRSSPALKETLIRLHSGKKPMEIDQHIYEFGAVEYHIQSSASDPLNVYLSISTPLLSHEVLQKKYLSNDLVEMIKGIHSDVLEIVEPTREGYQLTLKLDLYKIPDGKDSLKIITKISTVQAVILSCQLKEMLQNMNSQEAQGMYKPLKLEYHPREPFFVVRQQEKITAVFPMRFKENTDVIIATAFFQELVDVGSLDKWAKVPPCTWSPIPPPELRGETFEDLSTNGGFVSFDIYASHIKGKRLDKTVWSLLNFYAFVKYHVKCTRGFIQRRMRKRLDCLVEILHKPGFKEDENVEYAQTQSQGCEFMTKWTNISKTKKLKRRYKTLTKNIKRIHCPIKVHGFGRCQHRWLNIPKFSSTNKHNKLD